MNFEFVLFLIKLSVYNLFNLSSNSISNSLLKLFLKFPFGKSPICFIIILGGGKYSEKTLNNEFKTTDSNS